jgi:endonuclease III
MQLKRPDSGLSGLGKGFQVPFVTFASLRFVVKWIGFAWPLSVVSPDQPFIFLLKAKTLRSQKTVKSGILSLKSLSGRDMHAPPDIVRLLIETMGGKFSRELGIDVSTASRLALNKWFLAAKLFGARISSTIAARTYKEFERRGILLPEQILATGWDGLVEILDDGGYVRYDFSTATKLLSIMKDLQEQYAGDLNNLHEKALDGKDLEYRLKQLGKGIGDVTANIFLRELRTVWAKARPALSFPSLLAARHLGLIPEGNPLTTLEQLWAVHQMRGADFCDLEAALVRLGKDYCKKARHDVCPFRNVCGSP